MGSSASLFFSADAERQTLHRRITPSDEQFDAQQERWNELADFLRPKLRGETGLPTRTWLQGSYKFATQIRPVSPREEFDIDLGVYFEWDGTTEDGAYGPRDLRDRVQAALEAYAQDNDVVIEVTPPKVRCARIRYTENFHIDIPTYHLNMRDERALATQAGEWEDSDPKSIYIWFKEFADEQTRAKIRRLVRYLKAWAALKFDVAERPTSILLTVLVAEAANQVGFGSVSEQMMMLSTTCLKIIHDRLQQSRHVLNPVDDGEDLGSRMTKANFESFVDILGAFRNVAERAVGEERQAGSANVWQEAFEHLFPLPDQPVVNEAVANLPALRFAPQIQVTATPQSGEGRTFQDTNKIGPIPKKYDVKFELANWYELPVGAQVSWTVRNEGREAENLNDLGHSRAAGLSADETSAYKGRHFMDCVVPLQ